LIKKLAALYDILMDGINEINCIFSMEVSFIRYCSSSLNLICLLVQLLPIFILSLHFQTILAYFILNVISQPQKTVWAQNYYFPVSIFELILPVIAAVAISSKIKNEVSELNAELLRLMLEVENQGTLMKVTCNL